MVRRDYVERLIEQVVKALALMLRLREAGDNGRALEVVNATIESVLGTERALLERLTAVSVVELLGRFDRDRVRLYAMLLVAEGEVREEMGDGQTGRLRYQRARDLYEALASAGFRLDAEDRERMDGLRERLSGGR